MHRDLKTMDIDLLNKKLRHKSPQEIIKWAISNSKRPILTTNFGPHSASILHAVTNIKKDIKVLWVDTGYNTPNTYRFAKSLIERLDLNIKVYVPKETKGFRDVSLGIPGVDDPKHKTFTQEVKLEPFARALKENNPDLWFTNLRKGQTAFRDGLDIVSKNSDGVIKISPFYYWSDSKIESYLAEYELPNEVKYYDPTKQLANRECGLHTS